MQGGGFSQACWKREDRAFPRSQAPLRHLLGLDHLPVSLTVLSRVELCKRPRSCRSEAGTELAARPPAAGELTRRLRSCRLEAGAELTSLPLTKLGPSSGARPPAAGAELSFPPPNEARPRQRSKPARARRRSTLGAAKFLQPGGALWTRSW